MLPKPEVGVQSTLLISDGSFFFFERFSRQLYGLGYKIIDKDRTRPIYFSHGRRKLVLLCIEGLLCLESR